MNKEKKQTQRHNKATKAQRGNKYPAGTRLGAELDLTDHCHDWDAHVTKHVWTQIEWPVDEDGSVVYFKCTRCETTAFGNSGQIYIDDMHPYNTDDLAENCKEFEPDWDSKQPVDFIVVSE